MKFLRNAPFQRDGAKAAALQLALGTATARLGQLRMQPPRGDAVDEMGMLEIQTALSERGLPVRKSAENATALRRAMQDEDATALAGAAAEVAEAEAALLRSETAAAGGAGGAGELQLTAQAQKAVADKYAGLDFSSLTAPLDAAQSNLEHYIRSVRMGAICDTVSE